MSKKQYKTSELILGSIIWIIMIVGFGYWYIHSDTPDYGYNNNGYDFDNSGEVNGMDAVQWMQTEIEQEQKYGDAMSDKMGN